MATARDLMDPTPLTVGPEQGVLSLVREMANVHSYVACIIDGTDLVGIVSTRQIALAVVVDVLLEGEEPSIRTRDLSVTPPTAPPDQDAVEVLNLLHTSPAECVAVVDETGFIGIVTRRTVLTALSGESMEPKIIK